MVATLLVAGVIALASAIQLAAGFGFALVAVSMLALVVDAHVAVVVALQAGMIGNLYQSVEGRHRCHRGVAARLSGCALVGLPAGWWVYSRSDLELLQLLIGATVLLTVLALARGVTLNETSASVDALAGLVTGVLTTCTGTNGPPVVAVLQARKVAPDVFRATASTVFCVLDTLAISSFAVTGQLSRSALLTALLSLPGLVVGGWVGVRARTVLSPEVFRTVVLCLLTTTGVTAILSAVL